MNETNETTQTLEPERIAVRRAAVARPTIVREAPPVSHEPHLSRLHRTDDHDEDEGFFERHRVKLIAVAVVVIGGLITYVALHTERSQVKKAPERKVVNVEIPRSPAPPPPPPPPPKIQPPPPKEEKMIEQKPVEDTPKPPDKPVDEPPPSIGTGIKGDGKADGFGVGKTGNGGRIGGSGNGGGGGGRFDMYAGQVQTTIANGLRRNQKTRSATINRMTVRIWLDNTGRVTQAKLGGTTGDAAVDAAINTELAGTQLSPPPQGMPMPIVMRISAQRR